MMLQKDRFHGQYLKEILELPQIKFFLSRGDYFVVEKVAGELLFGRIEIPIDNNKKFEQFEGWVQNKNLEFIQ